jgi:ribosomal protein S18 acetylase RimI-like enzyme
MKSPRVRVMAAADEDPAVETVVLAFAADPMARPHAHQYLAAMPRLVRAFGGRAFSNGSAFCTDGYAGTALWLSPGIHPDEEGLDAVVESTVAPSLAVETAAVFEQMAKYHPTDPHWHLATIGVDPAHQGEGHGDALMAYALAQCDRDQAPAYLESSNPA